MTDNYFSLVPSGILSRKDLNGRDKLLLGSIIGLSGKHGYCYIGNEALAESHGITPRQVQISLSKLEKMKLIQRNVCKTGDRNMRTVRHLRVVWGVTQDHPRPSPNGDPLTITKWLPSTSPNGDVYNINNNNIDNRIKGTSFISPDDFPKLRFTEAELKKLRTKFVNEELPLELGFEKLSNWLEQKERENTAKARQKLNQSHYLMMIDWVLKAVRDEIRSKLDLDRSRAYAAKAMEKLHDN